jgi:hypothetical protein
MSEEEDKEGFAVLSVNLQETKLTWFLVKRKGKAVEG